MAVLLVTRRCAAAVQQVWRGSVLHAMFKIGSYGAEMCSALGCMTWAWAMIVAPTRRSAVTTFGHLIATNQPVSAVVILLLGMAHWSALYLCIRARYVLYRPCSVLVSVVLTFSALASLGLWAVIASSLFTIVSITPSARPFAVLLSVVCVLLVYALWRKD